MRIRILLRPRERELDGLPLDSMVPGLVRDVSPSVATWLIAEGYAVLEMRESGDSRQQSSARNVTEGANDRRRKI